MKAKLIKTDTNNFILQTNEGIISGTLEPTKFEYKLSFKNCQAVENGYDLDELARKRFNPEYESNLMFSIFEIDCKREGFVEGAKAILEILSDKKFSEEDIRDAMVAMANLLPLNKIDSYIQSLQQTEWDVEIDEHYVGECNGNDNNGCFLDSPGHNCGCYKKEFKLDSDGCLILKRI